MDHRDHTKRTTKGDLGMNRQRNQQLEDVIASLGDHIKAARTNALELPAMLLEMARLELQTQLHSISSEELRGFCDALRVRSLRSEPGGVSASAPSRPSSSRGVPPALTARISANQARAPYASLQSQIDSALRYHDRTHARWRRRGAAVRTSVR